MAPKHDEILRHQPGGWIVAWDANTVEPATRKAFDKVIADNARALREVVGAIDGETVSPLRQPAGKAPLARLRGSRRARATS